jgi:hypothetical protein
MRQGISSAQNLAYLLFPAKAVVVPWFDQRQLSSFPLVAKVTKGIIGRLDLWTDPCLPC